MMNLPLTRVVRWCSGKRGPVGALILAIGELQLLADGFQVLRSPWLSTRPGQGCPTTCRLWTRTGTRPCRLTCRDDLRVRCAVREISWARAALINPPTCRSIVGCRLEAGHHDRVGRRAVRHREHFEICATVRILILDGRADKHND